MSQGRSLAAGQTIPVRGDVDANVEQHLRLIRAAGEERAQILIFPELSLTGYELDLGATLAFSERDPRIEPLVAAAATYSMTLVVGAPIRLEQQLHIGAFIIGPNGAVDIYTKHHLGAFQATDAPDGIVPPPEGDTFTPGTRNPLVQFGGHTGAVSICADSGYRSHHRQAAALGARCYFSSQFAIPAHLGIKLELLKGCATHRAMTIVLSNFAGRTGGLLSAGNSGVWSEQGENIVQLGPSDCGVAIATEEPDGWRSATVLV